jgi:seryl-tRNA synthetase
MGSTLVQQYTNAMRDAVDKERRRSAAAERAAALDQELDRVISQYEALLARWEGAQQRGRVSASLTRKLDRVVMRRQQIIEEKIALGDLYVALAHEERAAQALVHVLRQQLEETLSRQRDEPPADRGSTWGEAG